MSGRHQQRRVLVLALGAVRGPSLRALRETSSANPTSVKAKRLRRQKAKTKAQTADDGVFQAERRGQRQQRGAEVQLVDL